MSEVFPHLFSSTKLAGHALSNRIAMAPLTRQMAEPDGTPTDEMAAYYARRARGGCGLIITEGTYQEDRLGCRAYLSQPGIANGKHVAGWRKVTDAVHKHGVVIILQLMHGGRVTDPRCLAHGEQPVSASDTRSDGWTLYTDTDDEKTIRNIRGDWPKVTFGPARALTISEIHQVADGFAAGHFHRLSRTVRQNSPRERRHIGDSTARWIGLIFANDPEALLAAVTSAEADGHAERCGDHRT